MAGIITKLLDDADNEKTSKQRFQRQMLLDTVQNDKADPEHRGMAMEQLLKEAKLGPKESGTLLHMIQTITGGGGTEMADQKSQPLEDRPVTGPAERAQQPQQPQSTPSSGGRLRSIGRGAAQIGISALEGMLTQGRSAQADIQNITEQRQQKRELERQQQQSQLRTQEKIGEENRGLTRFEQEEQIRMDKAVAQARQVGQINSQQEEVNFRAKWRRAQELIKGGMGEEQAYTTAGLPYKTPPLKSTLGTGARKGEDGKWYRVDLNGDYALDSDNKRIEAPTPSSERPRVTPLNMKEADDWLEKNPGKGYSDFLVWKSKQTASGQSNLTADALQMAARMFISTGGQTPSFGMAGAKDKEAILNAAAKIAPDTDLATQKATYAALDGSLKSIQKNRDAVVTFERTATANLDRMLDRAKGIVDAGVPWMNTPLRDVDRNGLGSQEQLAYDAARQVAINEIAKVVSNPNLTGQLSDSARKEVEAFIPANATLAQVYSVAAVLKADMATRHSELDSTISNLQTTLKQLGPQAKSTDRDNKAQPGKFNVNYKGKVYPFDTQEQADEFKTKLGIKPDQK